MLDLEWLCREMSVPVGADAGADDSRRRLQAAQGGHRLHQHGGAGYQGQCGPHTQGNQRR